MHSLRLSLLATNLFFALILLPLDKGMALINIACAFVVAIELTIRWHNDEKGSTDEPSK